MSEQNKFERDFLIDDIINEVSKGKRENNTEENISALKQGEALSRANEIMSTLFPDEFFAPKTENPIEVDSVVAKPEESELEETYKVETKREKPKKVKKNKNDQDQGVLSKITPWDERRKQHVGDENDAFVNMEGHKEAREFYAELKTRSGIEKAEEKINQEPQQEEQQEDVKIFSSEREDFKPTIEVPVEEMENRDVFVEEDTKDDAKEYSFEPTKHIEIPQKSNEQLSNNGDTIVMDSVDPNEKEIQMTLPGFGKSKDKKIEGEFVKRRREIVEQFEVDSDALPFEEQETEQDRNDYNGIEDAEPMRMDLLVGCRRIKNSLIFTALLALISTVLAILTLDGVAAFPITEHGDIYLAVNLVIMLVAIVVNNHTVFSSLSGLFGKNDPSGAAGASLGLLNGFCVNVLFFFFLNDYAMTSLPLFNCIYLWAFVLVLIAKNANLNRTKENFELVANEKIKTSVSVFMQGKDTEALASGLSIGIPEVAVTKKGVNLTNFLYHSLAQDEGDRASFYLSYAIIPLGFICGALSFFFAGENSKDMLYAITAYSGAVAVMMPFAGILGGGRLISKICKNLRRERIMISGYDAADLCKNVNVLAVEAADLFPDGTVTLHGMRAASAQAIDRSIQDVAAVVIADGGPLAPVFTRIVQEKMAILPNVEATVYEEGMGISGWVSGNRVLVGNRALMDHHEIYIPENNFEQEASEQGLIPVYLSTDGHFAAVFLVKYSPSRRIAEELKNAVRKGMSINIFSNDPFINHEKVCKLFSLPSKTVKFMDTSARKAYKNILSTEEDLLSAVMMHIGDAGSTARILTAAQKINRLCRIMSVLQYILTGVALCTVFVLVLKGGAGALTLPIAALCYLITLLISELILRLFAN